MLVLSASVLGARAKSPRMPADICPAFSEPVSRDGMRKALAHVRDFDARRAAKGAPTMPGQGATPDTVTRFLASAPLGAGVLEGGRAARVAYPVSRSLAIHAAAAASRPVLG